jgi:hypothetical protein
MADNFEVDPARLRATGNGIHAAIEHLKGLGLDYTAEQGRNFGGLAMSEQDLGSAELSGALERFCDQWSWGVRGLVQDGAEFANRLGQSAGAYADTETYLQDAFIDAAKSVLGDPQASDDQVSHQSFAQIGHQASTPDYSSDSFRNAGDQIGQTWKDEASDLAREAIRRALNPIDPMGLGPNPLQGLLPPPTGRH